jgi:hypothetical protein
MEAMSAQRGRSDADNALKPFMLKVDWVSLGASLEIGSHEASNFSRKYYFGSLADAIKQMQSFDNGLFEPAVALSQKQFHYLRQATISHADQKTPVLVKFFNDTTDAKLPPGLYLRVNDTGLPEGSRQAIGQFFTTLQQTSQPISQTYQLTMPAPAPVEQIKKKVARMVVKPKNRRLGI